MNQLPTRQLGSDGPAVSAVGYGGMHLSIAGRPDRAQAIRALHAALDAGITFVDTADVYCLHDGEIGHNERLIAEGLSSWRGPRDTIVVATKGGLARPDGRWERNARPEHLRKACERSLKALGTDEIFLYQLHAPDHQVPFAESVGALARLREEGKIRRVGLSNVSAAQLDEARDIVPITSVQNRLNPFFREALDDGVVAACEQHAVTFIAYSPVGGGRLNLQLPGHPVVRALASEVGATPHQVVLAWVRQLSPRVIPIPSAREPEHAAQSAQSAEVELSDDQRSRLTEAAFSTA